MIRKSVIIFINVCSLAIYIMTVIVFLQSTWTDSPEKIAHFAVSINTMDDIDRLREAARLSVELEHATRTYVKATTEKYVVSAGCFFTIFICQMVLLTKEWRAEKKRLTTAPPAES